MDKKKVVAAMSAVMQYIRTEEEVICAAAAFSKAHQVQAAPAPAVPPVSISLWGISGRQTMMQMRNLMQLKAFPGLKVR